MCSTRPCAYFHQVARALVTVLMSRGVHKPNQFLPGVPKRFSISRLLRRLWETILYEFYKSAFLILRRDDNHLNVWFDNNPKDVRNCVMTSHDWQRRRLAVSVVHVCFDWLDPQTPEDSHEFQRQWRNINRSLLALCQQKQTVHLHLA